MDNSNWYNIKNIDELDSPCLVVLPERVKYNIKKAVEMVGGADRLIPHIKTHKTTEVTRLCQEAGIQKFKCATIAESELLGICEVKEVILAYQPIGKKINRFIALIKKYPNTSFSCLTDNEAIAANISEKAVLNNLNIGVFIDINSGMDRTGIIPEKAVELAEKIKILPSIKLLGLHCYDGNIRNIDFSERKKFCDKSFSTIENCKNDLEKLGFLNLRIVVGGSPTFPIHAKRKNVECSPGTFVFWDKGYSDLCPEQPFLPAILAITRIISLPTPTRICTDLGHKSIAAENDLSKRVYLLNAAELKFAGQSEEHLILDAPENHHYKVGDILYGVPIHVCPTVALHERLYVVEKEVFTGEEWRVLARDRVIEI